jgi:hypothetical protein
VSKTSLFDTNQDVNKHKFRFLMDYTVSNIITSIFFLFLVLGIYKLIPNHSPKNVVQEQELQPKLGGGWLYAIERDGYIKIGRSNYKEVESSDKKQKSLENRIKDYANPSEIPYTFSVNLIYFHYFEDHVDMEKCLKSFMNSKTPKLTAYQEYADYELYPVAQKDEWFKYNHSFEKTRLEIIKWFKENRSFEPYVKRLVEEALSNLHNQDRVFIHQYPEA